MGGNVLDVVLEPKPAGVSRPPSPTSSWGVWEHNRCSSPPARFCLCPAPDCHYPALYCSHSSPGERLGDDIKVGGDAICITASPPFFSPSPCPFSCTCSIPARFYPPQQTAHPFTQLAADGLNKYYGPSVFVWEWPKWHVTRGRSRGRFLCSHFKRPQQIQK